MRVLKLEELDQVSGGTFFLCKPKKLSIKWGCFKGSSKSGSGRDCKPKRSCGSGSGKKSGGKGCQPEVTPV